MHLATHKPSSILEEFVENARLKHVPSGQILMYAHDTPADAYILKSGVVKIYDIDDKGNEKILHLVKPYSVVPFAFFSGLEKPLQWYYTTLTDCEMYVVPADDLAAVIDEHGALGQLLVKNFSDDVHYLLARFSGMSKSNTEDKVLATLAFLAENHAVPTRAGSAWRKVTFPVTHQLLADMSGITRESTALVMKDISDRKIIRNPSMTTLEINHSKITEPL